MMFVKFISFAFVEHTPLMSRRIEKINRHDLFSDLLSNSRDCLMLRMICIVIKACPVMKMSDQAGVERAFKVKDVGTHVKARDTIDHRGQGAQSGDMIGPRRGVGFHLVFPANNMN